jgi:hypothetical protein
LLVNWPLLIDPTAALVEFARDNPDDFLALSTAKYRKSKWLLPLLCEWGEDGRNQISYPFGLWLPPQFAIAHVIAIAGQLAISGYLGIGTGFVDEEGSGIVLMYLNLRFLRLFLLSASFVSIAHGFLRSVFLRRSFTLSRAT